MMIQLTQSGKQMYLQFSAILYMRKRFFFKGSIIGMVGGTTVKADQDPQTIIDSLAHASQEASKMQKSGK